MPFYPDVGKDETMTKRPLLLVTMIFTITVPFLLEFFVLGTSFYGVLWSLALIPIMISLTLYPSWKTVFFLGLLGSSLKYTAEFQIRENWSNEILTTFLLSSVINWSVLLVAASFILANIRLKKENGEATEALIQERSFLAAVLDTMEEGVLVSDCDGNLVYTNKAFARDYNALTGIEMEKWINYYPVYHDDGTPFKLEELPLYVALTEKRETEAEMWLTDRKNMKKRLRVKGAPLENGAVVLTRDITEQRQNEETLKYFAYTDPLTGLVNRRSFLTRLEQVTNTGNPHALLFVDCNRFKEINDTYGHRAGDRVLQALSRVLVQSVSGESIVSRLAGDEFTVLIPYNEASEIKERIELIRHGCQIPVYINEATTISYGISMGISLFPKDAADPDELLHRADQAMYQAKQKKEIINPYVFYGE